MNRVAALASVALLSAVPCFAQTPQALHSDSQTLQAILAEMRAIHNDVRLGQTTQLLLAELELQGNIVSRALLRRDDLRSKLSETQAGEKEVTEKLARFQENPDPGTTPEEKANLADFKEQLEHSSATLNAQEVERTNNLQEAESSLRKEQATQENIQGQLNDIVKKLQPAN